MSSLRETQGYTRQSLARRTRAFLTALLALLLSASVVSAQGVAVMTLTTPLAIVSATTPSSMPLLRVQQTLPNDGKPGVPSAAAQVGLSVPAGYRGYPWALSSGVTSRASDPATQVAGGYFAGYTLGGSPAWGINPVARDHLNGEVGAPAPLIGAEVGVGKANAASFGLGLHLLSEGPRRANVGLMISGAAGAAWDVGADIEVEAVPLMLREVDGAGRVTAAWRFVTDGGWLRLERDPLGKGDFATFSVVYAVAPDGTLYLGGAPGLAGNTAYQPSLAVLPNGGGVVLYGPLVQGAK